MAKVGVIGLGKLGLPLAATLDRSGHEVWGYDINPALICNLRRGQSKLYEPDLIYWGVHFATDVEWMVSNTDLAFICVNTPTLRDDTMDIGQVQSAVDAVRAINPEYPLVICSTVLPGTCRELRCMSMPVWVALGSVVHDLQHPPVFLLGCDCDRQDETCSHYQVVVAWGRVLQSPFQSLILTDTRTAEFTKLAHNTWCCTKMAWLGNIGDQAEKLGIDIAAISEFFTAGGERPGKFWKYGPPYGGLCFPRDLGFWRQIIFDPIGCAVEGQNTTRYKKLAQRVPYHSRVVILGKGYKAGQSVEEASPSLALATELRIRGCLVQVVDDVAEIAHPEAIDYWVAMHGQPVTASIPAEKVINPWLPQERSV